MLINTVDARELLDDFDLNLISVSVPRIRIDYETGRVEITLNFLGGRTFVATLRNDEEITQFWNSLFPIGDTDENFVRRGRVLYYKGYLVKELTKDSIIVSQFITLDN